MSEMIERVARAIAKTDAPYQADQFDILSAATQDLYRRKAVEAIKSMREPTELMCNEGWDSGVRMVVPYGFCIGGETPVWQAMIDAALYEDQ